MADDNGDDKPLFELKMGSMSLGRDKSGPELTREQRQELIDERLPKAKLGAIDNQIDAELNPSDVLDQYTPKEQAVIKAALAKECFRVWGDETSKIEGIVSRDDGRLEAKVDKWFYASIDPDKAIADHKALPATPTPVHESTAEKTPVQEPEAVEQTDRAESAPETVQEPIKSEVEKTPDSVSVDSLKAETSALNEKPEAIETTSLPDQKNDIPERAPEQAQPAREDSIAEITLESSVPEPNISQEVQQDLNERFDQKMHNINNELERINTARSEPEYWEGNPETIAIDTARSDELMAERQALYALMDQSVNEQLEYFKNQAEPLPLSDQAKLSNSTEETSTITASQSAETIAAAEPVELTAEELTQLDQDLKAIDEEYATRVRIVEEDPTLLDSVKKSALDTFDTSAALLETAAKETVNFGTKMGMNVGATALGAIHGINEGSLDEGISAMRSIRDESMGRYRIETSDFAKEQLSQSAIAEIGTWLQEKGEAAYSAIEEKYGTNIAELVKGTTGAAGC